jgi:hypothetical protein
METSRRRRPAKGVDRFDLEYYYIEIKCQCPSSPTRDIMASGRRTMADASSFLDAEGRVTRWPKKKAEKLEVLRYLRGKMLPGVAYSERQVNELLGRWHLFGDHALLRREMYDNYLIDRTPDGREYRVREEEGSR